jgi:hypothetical protein
VDLALDSIRFPDRYPLVSNTLGEPKQPE